jgi:hypothetical protein
MSRPSRRSRTTNKQPPQVARHRPANLNLDLPGGQCRQTEQRIQATAGGIAQLVRWDLRMDEDWLMQASSA